jgi:hypothetical protein
MQDYLVGSLLQNLHILDNELEQLAGLCENLMRNPQGWRKCPWCPPLRDLPPLRTAESFIYCTVHVFLVAKITYFDAVACLTSIK